jgi:hypothetical protein
MKKFIVALLCLSCTCFAHEHGWSVALKQGYFVPQNKTLRTIFDGCGSKGGYFVEGALRYNVWKCLYVEMNASYFGHKGRALVSTTSDTEESNNSCCTYGECIKFKMPTFGAGLKYYFWFSDRTSFFVGAGLKGFFARIENDSPYVPHNDNQSSIGAFVHAGFLFDVYKGLSLELFGDYLGSRLKCPWQNTSSTRYKLDVSGFACGIGLDYCF